MGFSEIDYSPMSESDLTNAPETPSPLPSNRLVERVIGRGNSSISALSLLMLNLAQEVQSFIERNDMWPVVGLAYAVKHELGQSMTVGMQVVVERDAEAPDREELILIYSIANKEYKEILHIWNDISRRVHRALPPIFSDKVYVRLTKA